MSAQRGRDGCPQPSADDALDRINAELQNARRGRLGQPSLPGALRRGRKPLPHTVPWWVKNRGIFFITINCQPRRRNHLAKPDVAKVVLNAAEFYHDTARWYVALMLLMPDHLHGLISFPTDEVMKSVVTDWKKYLAREHGIAWQRDFFDHRLRHDESCAEKADYIRENPVRAGLAKTADEWPHVITHEWLW